ncbi:hypothetical protein Scep_014464 [Stephania cephalantha]|uniref:Uncharacterized protein n=1 Tax=Stephania cephalantha TaxID=152367 RepID=A0AAP0P0E5_9MAGN
MVTSIGMMDATYFVGRTEILAWINSTLHLNLSIVEKVRFFVFLPRMGPTCLVMRDGASHDKMMPIGHAILSSRVVIPMLHYNIYFATASKHLGIFINNNNLISNSVHAISPAYIGTIARSLEACRIEYGSLEKSRHGLKFIILIRLLTSPESLATNMVRQRSMVGSNNNTDVSCFMLIDSFKTHPEMNILYQKSTHEWTITIRNVISGIGYFWLGKCLNDIFLTPCLEAKLSARRPTHMHTHFEVYQMGRTQFSTKHSVKN